MLLKTFFIMKRKQLINELVRISDQKINLSVNFNDGCPYLSLHCSVIDALLLVQYLPPKFSYAYSIE